MDAVLAEVERLAAETNFSGVVRVDAGGDPLFIRAYGMADRSCGRPNTLDGQFGVASGTKGLTACTIASLVETGELALATTARSLLGNDLPLIADDVTVEHLLAHTSGIGDYCDESEAPAITDYILPVPVHELATTEAYLSVLDGHHSTFGAGARFAYNNSGYVVLALLAERATGMSFYDLVAKRVCVPAGMHDTAFLRSDELPGRAAVGYLEANGLRTNVLHLAVRGSGDGGIYTTAADITAFWAALLDNRIVPGARVRDLLRPRSDYPAGSMRYGLGFWLHESRDVAMLEGSDAGISFRTVHNPARALTHTVLANTSSGAWPLTIALDELLEI